MESKILASNKSAKRDFEILKYFEAGLSLLGPEVKSIRQGNISIRESYARIVNNEVFLFNCHIAITGKHQFNDIESKRSKKLLLNKKEITFLKKETQSKNLTLGPIKIYSKKHILKIEIGLARGKKKYEKRKVIIERERARESMRALKNNK